MAGPWITLTEKIVFPGILCLYLPDPDPKQILPHMIRITLAYYLQKLPVTSSYLILTTQLQYAASTNSLCDSFG